MPGPTWGRPVPGATGADDTLLRLAIEYAKAILGDRLDIGLPVLEGFCEQLSASLAFHQGQFEQAGKPSDRQSVIGELRRGHFAFGTREDCDLLADFFVARLYGARIGAAAKVFTDRFGEAIHSWARRYAPDDPDLADSILADLLLPRARSGPRIDSYKAQGPLDGWLRQVVLSQAARRRRQRGVVVPVGVDTAPHPVPDLGPGPDEQYARKDCAEILFPLFRQVLGDLPKRERLVLMMALVDGVPQRRIAELLRLPQYTVSRVKSRAIDRVHRVFFALAREARGMGNQSVRDCLDLLLDGFPGVELDLPAEEAPAEEGGGP